MAEGEAKYKVGMVGMWEAGDAACAGVYAAGGDAGGGNSGPRSG